MKKSVYSLMLFDEIVEEIDQIAYENNTNRSQLINDILAEYLGLMTPEQKIQRILEQLYGNFRDELTVSQINKNSSIHFGKSIKFKYRPKIKYSFEFAGTGAKKYAVLKISSRTKSAELNNLFDEFFHKIADLEIKNNFHSGSFPTCESNHKFIREFKLEGSVSRDVNEVSKFLTDYLKMVDEAMNLFFSDTSTDIDERLQEIYDHFFMRTDLQVTSKNPLKVVENKNSDKQNN